MVLVILVTPSTRMKLDPSLSLCKKAKFFFTDSSCSFLILFCPDLKQESNFPFCFLPLFFRPDFTLKPRLASDLEHSACLSLSSAGISGRSNHGRLQPLLFLVYVFSTGACLRHCVSKMPRRPEITQCPFRTNCHGHLT